MISPGRRQRDHDCPAAPSSRFFARSRPPGVASGTTCRANAAACGDTDDGSHRPI